MLITKKEKVEQFKRDLRSLTYYKAKHDELCDRLLQLDRNMHEARANRYHQEPGATSYSYLDLMHKEEECMLEKQLFELLMKRIADVLEQLDSSDKKLILDIYVYKKSYASLSMKLFMSERNLKYHVDAILKQVL